MRKIVLFITVMFITHLSYSQVFVQDVNINDLDIEYVQLVGVNTSMFGVKIKVFVDYGQEAKLMKADAIKNATGKTMKFNSMIHALNFMNDNGWKYTNYTETIVSSKLRYVYLLENKDKL
ncbi:MAG: hypothetical protein L3J09_02115 [Flavobacteriaceae bacterium]|nr:hypothetical protein [Flavobacteriaceae bacterium]